MSRHPSTNRSHEIKAAFSNKEGASSPVLGAAQTSDESAVCRAREKDTAMKPGFTLTDRLLLVVAKTPDCRIEDVVDHFPDLPWNEVFHAVTRLSRDGRLQLLINGQGMLVRRRDEILAAPSSN